MHIQTKKLLLLIASALISGADAVDKCVAAMTQLPDLTDVQENFDWRAIPVLLFLGWTFLGVAIIADMFMAAIEEITSQKRTVTMKDGRKRTGKVWNDTVANLTLMAFGSSAPEILLSCLEITFNDFFAADLGPGTIVGSAAFNLLVIIAVCVYVIPAGEIRLVKEKPVLLVTGTASVFAYLWIVVCLQLITPNKIDWYEGLLTLLYFPVLVVLSFMADKGYFTKAEAEEEGVATVSATKTEQVSRAKRHMEAMQVISAGKRAAVLDNESNQVTISFECSLCHANPDEEDVLTLSIIRDGNLSSQVTVSCRYTTEDAARQSERRQSKRLSFHPGEMQKLIAGKTIGLVTFEVDQAEATLDIPLKGDDAPTVDSGPFMVELFDPKVDKDMGTKIEKISLGAERVCQVEMVKDVGPGQLCFMDPDMKVAGLPEPQDMSVSILRLGGSDGEVTCKFRTEKISATPGRDYEDVDTTITFKSGQAQCTQTIRILDKKSWEQSDQFRMIIEEATGGAEFNPDDDGGEDSCIAVVTICGRGESGNTVLQSVDKYLNVDMLCGGWDDWKEQMFSAWFVNGSWEEMQQAEKSDWVKHFIALPWKVVFSLVPPTSFFGGWLCFVVAIFFLGLITMLAGDAASIFGCLIGLEDQITAITCVALGTSLPDTFASMSAAVNDETADASIGNVTGSNSVNVFFGLGLPWLIAALYWEINGKTDDWKDRYQPNGELLDILDPDLFKNGGFVVPAGNLVFSVATFVLVSLICMGTLALRRKFIGAELGGPVVLKTSTSMFLQACGFFTLHAPPGKCTIQMEMQVRTNLV
jgi:solute carrier family 8 (sodium/calcium exchanger)